MSTSMGTRFEASKDVDIRIELIGAEQAPVIVLDGFLAKPETVAASAKEADFAQINPFYPGIRARVSSDWTKQMSAFLEPYLSDTFGAGPWDGDNWFSIVTTPPSELQPIQRLPHVDGTDSDQIATLLYLHHTGHGGTAFFRHKTTGYESLTPERFPKYRKSLEHDISESGLPEMQYIETGAPHFEQIAAYDGAYNRMIIYRGNLLHSGIIRNDKPLSANPTNGRLTMNAFLRRQTA